MVPIPDSSSENTPNVHLPDDDRYKCGEDSAGLPHGVDCSARAAAVSAGVRRGSAVSRCLTSEPDIYPANVLASRAGPGWAGLGY